MICGIEIDSKSSLLRSLDIAFSFIFVTPLALIWWSGTWKLLDFYVYPSETWKSWFVCYIVGNIICSFCWFLNPLIARGVTHWNAFRRSFVIFFFNYISSLASLSVYRGLWDIADQLVKDNPTAQDISVVIFVASEVLLLLLRANVNNVPNPFGVGTEVGFTFQIAVPRFRSTISDYWWYTADVLVTQFLINSAVILVWRTVWEMITATISPQDQFHKHLVCACIGGVACFTLLAFNYFIYLAAKALADVHWLCVYVFEGFMNICATVAGLLLWVGCWQILEETVIGPDKWQAWLFHYLGFLLMAMMQVTTSIAGLFCAVDGDLPNGGSLWWSIDYVTAWYQWREGRRELVQLPVGVDAADCQPIIEDAGIDVNEYDFGDDYDPIEQLIEDVVATEDMMASCSQLDL